MLLARAAATHAADLPPPSPLSPLQGQPCRLLLKLAGIDFEDKLYTVKATADGGCVAALRSPRGARTLTLLRAAARRWDLSAWLDVKPTLGARLAFPNLPYYLDGEVAITEHSAIVLHVAKQARLMGQTDAARATALMLFGVASDVRSAYVTLSYSDDFEAKKRGFLDDCLAKAVAQLDALAAKRAAKGPFIRGAQGARAVRACTLQPPLRAALAHARGAAAGPGLTRRRANGHATEDMTFADVVWYDLLEQSVAMDATCLQAAPHVQAMMAAVAALPQARARSLRATARLRDGVTADDWLRACSLFAQIAAYRASPEFIDHPYNNVMASFK